MSGFADYESYDALGLADLEIDQLMRLVTGESLHR